MSNIEVINKNTLTFKGKTYTCAIGENGFTAEPEEGGKKTPIGNFALRECWYRADRVTLPKINLPLKKIAQDDGWCDAPEHPSYNLHVKLPFPASHEKLWLENHTYDIIVPIGFNDTNIVGGKGSAIFFHLAKPGYKPTLGCVAVSLEDMLKILPQLNKDSRIIIKPQD